MTMPGNIKDREYDKFFETPDGKTGVRTGDDSKTITLVSQTSSYIYIGTALTQSSKSASVWKIKRVQISGGDVEILLADGGNFNQVWDDRETLTYE